MTEPPKGRDALDEIERRFAQLLGRLGQTFEEAMSNLPEGTAQVQSRNFSGTVDDFLAARAKSTPVEDAETVEDAEPKSEGAAQPEPSMSSVNLNVAGGKVTVSFDDPDRAPLEIDLPEARIGASWRVSVGGGTLRFDPD